MRGPTAAWLPDGQRLHFQHGPIDLIIEASGTDACLDAAYRAAWSRFQTVLGELVDELPKLRTMCPLDGLHVEGRIAGRMERACRPHAALGITSMAAVAGAVADEILDAMTAAAELRRAYVNNGGDIAIHLAEGQKFEVAMAGLSPVPSCLGKISLKAGDPSGLASSGRHGRSLSLGIADSVTVLARNAAAADAAATLIANAVDLPGHPNIQRMPAVDLDPESDLGERLVTVDIELLTEREVCQALAAGTARAHALITNGTIAAAVLYLEDQVQVVGNWPKRCAFIDFSSKLRSMPPRQLQAGPL